MMLENIVTPTLLLDQERGLRNMHDMITRAKANGIILRPHFKTHQSLEIGRWFRVEGIDRITVSSLGMADYFADDGWSDITVAFPVNVRQLQQINDLAARVRLGLIVVDMDGVQALGRGAIHPVSVWIKIDIGTHRTGIDPLRLDQINGILEQLDTFPLLTFAGFIGHAGHTYGAKSKEEILAIYSASLVILNNLKSKFIDRYPDLQISVGDTPATSMADDAGEVDEWRPGNFIFYDVMQYEIGSCTLDDIAVAMACPVVAVHRERLQWIVYGGGIHFAKDFLLTPDGNKCFGRMVRFRENAWTVDHVLTDPYLISLSQEHGVVQCTQETFDLCKPGDLAFFLPVHSCLTADVMGAYLSLSGDELDHYRRRVR